MHFLQAINSDLSVLIDCNKTGGTIKGDIKKKYHCTVHSDVCRVHSPTNALLFIYLFIYFYCTTSLITDYISTLRSLLMACRKCIQ